MDKKSEELMVKAYLGVADFLNKTYGTIPKGSFRCGRCQKAAKRGVWRKRGAKVCMKCSKELKK